MRSVFGSSCKVSSNLILLASSRDFPPSLCSSLAALTWLVVENSLLPVTTLIKSTLARFKLSNSLCADVTGFWRPRPDFLNRIKIKVTTARGRVFAFLKKRQGKKVLQRSFSTPANEHTVSFINCYKNIHYDWIACEIYMYISHGYLTTDLMIVPTFFTNSLSVQ